MCHLNCALLITYTTVRSCLENTTRYGLWSQRNGAAHIEYEFLTRLDNNLHSHQWANEMWKKFHKQALVLTSYQKGREENFEASLVGACTHTRSNH